MAEFAKLIVGLGNPGSEYQNTRHNAGEWYVRQLAKDHNALLKVEPKHHGLVSRITLQGRDVRLLIPTTFMNRSGQAVSSLAQFYKISPEEILVAHDEMAIDPGVAKFKRGGGHAGHNGLRDIISCLGNNKNFLRLRIGIGHPGDKNRVSGFVLGKASQSEQNLIDAAIDESLRCTDIWYKQDLSKAMNRLHSFKG
ncbi:aminoacyl-tRNA hydrolase [Saccharobesus litoralis]|uniref:Peptidyl-tRNA hydrolase n=1 Tax=Saccharobesus litoralis TaxID=2172099 RepID=A0A2S0VS50_9ALTE|nr:aminoacyl-tRNA hydrolase [Saccharobesus litoralis]AWB67034.1 aminoacyl-tRNA hydrolase [Saccharobesus litoralis]